MQTYYVARRSNPDEGYWLQAHSSSDARRLISLNVHGARDAANVGTFSCLIDHGRRPPIGFISVKDGDTVPIERPLPQREWKMKDGHRYQLFFFDQSTKLVGHEEFSAANFQDAYAIGAAIFEACHDACASYELWFDHERIDSGPKELRLPRASELSEKLMDLALEREEFVANSHWAIAQSKRLLATLSLRPERDSKVRAG